MSMNAFVLVSEYNGELSVSLYSESNFERADSDFLDLVKESIEPDQDTLEEFDFSSDFNGNWNGAELIYSPGSSFFDSSSGYTIALELHKIHE